MGEGTVFSLFVSPHLSGGWGGGVPQSGLDGGWGGVIPVRSRWGGAPSQVWVEGVPHPRSGAVPHLRSGVGGTPSRA